MEWEQFAGFGIEFRYPTTTSDGQPVKRDEEGERVHVHSPDRQEVYVEVRRFRGITPQDEYEVHKPYLVRRFGAISDLTETTLLNRDAWTYSFGWSEDGRPMQRKAVLLQIGADTFRIIYDPRSPLNEQVIGTVRFDGN